MGRLEMYVYRVYFKTGYQEKVYDSSIRKALKRYNDNMLEEVAFYIPGERRTHSWNEDKQKWERRIRSN